MGQGESLGKLAARGLAIMGSILGILGLPAWIYLGKGSPDELWYLPIITFSSLGVMFLLFLTLIIYQNVTNMDISKTPLWKRLFGQ